ncbi:Mannose-1-phosphate guanyltransferase [Venturia nashicola]|uniref:Mannose-1-phosphate guanyltransferase n=1 Tax=Venturia nashicola TaxID=86259 RepID=A0A4Z1NQ06_9PEZI|nr:Mannose-1-phosphate guanyltransferase [Venturia nashicola]TLD21592.1 Mannose-1-phosphate guanyltransferase [Venturia nashicola]
MLRTRLPSLAAACLRRNLTTSRPTSPQAFDNILGFLHEPSPTSKLPQLRWDYDRDERTHPPQFKNQRRKARPLPTHQPHLEVEPNTRIAPGLFVVDNDNGLHKHVIRRFNVALQCVYMSPYHDYHRQTLISCYEALKRDAPQALKCIPSAAWALLWKAHIPFRPLDADRLPILEMLHKDMEAHKDAVDGEVREAYRSVLDLEQLAENGKQEEAVEQWKQKKCYLEVGRKGRKSWMELGARLHAMAGDIDTASSYTEEVMRRYKLVDPRLRFFIIWRHAEIKEGDAYRRAAAMYTDLVHNRRRFNLSTDDYHSLFAAFVKGGHLQTALEILKDVAKDKYLSDAGLRVYALRSMSDKLQAACKDRKSLNAVSLACLGFLPQDFRMEELFHRWIYHAQRFWSPGEDDVCAQIAELMFERGDTPDARHLNILLKAWFESSGHDFTEQAESVAWGMIHKRMETEERAKMDGKTLQANLDNVPAFLRRRIPSAIATTFTQLAGGYVRQGKHEYAFYVLNLLANSDITMDKKALRAVIQLHITMDEPIKAWQVFVKIRDAQPSAINLHTYFDLWRGLIKFVRSLRKTHEVVGEPGHQWHLKIRKSFEGIKYPNPRALFSEMLNHMQDSTSRTEPKGEPNRIPRHLYDRVIGTMLFTGDVLGASIAMEIMRNSTQLYPTLTTIKMIVQYTAEEAKKTERKQGINEPTKHYYDMAYGVLEYIYINLEQHAGGRTPKVSDLYNEGLIRLRGEDILATLLKYLRLLMERYWGSEEMVEKYEFAARTQMAMSSMEAMLNRKLEIWG